MMTKFKCIENYNADVVSQVKTLVKENRLKDYLKNRYPTHHDIRNEKALYLYAQSLKNQYIKKSASISKVIYDPKIQLVKNALGTHSYVSRIQGGKLKSKQEIRIASIFKFAPIEMLDMILVHELAHLKEKDHNKAFYKLCNHMQADYHQVEFDTRLFLIEFETNGPIY